MNQNKTEYSIIFDPKPSLKDTDILNARISAYAREKKDLDPIEPFAFFVKGQKGQVLAGCSGEIFYGCLYTGSLWETFREMLPLDAETWARGRVWALWKAMIVAAGFVETNAVEAAHPWRTIEEVLADYKRELDFS